MTTQQDIITSMQFSIVTGKTVNSSASPRETITYEYAGTSQPVDFTSTSRTGWTEFAAAEKATFEAALAHIETFLNVDFVEVFADADPDLNVGKVDFTGLTTGLGGLSTSYIGDTITRVDSFVIYKNTLDLATETSLLLHELGHSLGLKHPFSSPVVPDGTDSNKYSIMSYTVNPDTGLDAVTMQYYDMVALQDLWGAAGYNSSDTTYTGKRNETTDTIWDTGGIDHFDASARTTAVILDLREGRFSTFGTYEDVVVAYNTEIENASGGSGGDSLFGNGLDNVLRGGNGKDALKGLSGADELRGGNGRDKLFGGNGADDLLGGKGNDRLRGDGGKDVLVGGAGRDKFIFKDGSGKDTITDFENDTDTLIIGFAGIATVDDALGKAGQVGANVVFKFDDGSKITVEGMTIADITDDISII